MKDTDRILIGTAWIRSKGKHYPTVGTIDSVGSRGPRLKVEGETNRKNSSYIRLVWAELGNQWLPENNEAQNAYDRWAQQTALDIAADEKTLLDNFTTSIESETKLSEKNGVLEMASPETAVKECHGAWHRHGKNYELIPLTEFSIATRGPNIGQLASICDSCKAKSSKADKRRPAPLVIEPKVQTSEGTYYRWRVTVIQTVEHIVQGKDLLDVAAQVDTLGRVIKVEEI